MFNGSSVSEGEVQYCVNSTWTPVCGDDWDESEAAVACRQLGFAGEGRDINASHGCVNIEVFLSLHAKQLSISCQLIFKRN